MNCEDVKCAVSDGMAAVSGSGRCARTCAHARAAVRFKQRSSAGARTSGHLRADMQPSGSIPTRA